MAIRDNRDGTFTDTDTGQVLGTPRETGGRNVRSSIRDVQRAVGGRGQAAPPPAATTSDDPVADILARLAAAIIDGSDTNAFNNDILDALIATGLVRGDALDLLNSIADATEASVAAGEPNVDDIVATAVGAGGVPADGDILGGDEGPQGASVEDLLGGGGGFIGEDEDFFTDPAFRGQALSLSAGGRDQLFNELVAQASLGAGGAAPFVDTFAQRLRNPLEQLFRFGQQLPLASQENIDPSTLPNFQQFASGFQGVPGGGAFQNVVDQITQLQGGGGGEFDPFVSGIPDFFRSNPNAAFGLGFGASGISPFNPFADAFRSSSQRRFNAALGQGGDPFQFLQGVGSGNFGNFFG